MKKIIKLSLTVIIIVIFSLFIRNYFNIYKEKEIEKDCIKNGFLFDKTLYLKNVSNKDFINSKLIAFKKGSNFKIRIDSTDIYLETELIKENFNEELKFKKPVTTNADWKIILKNNTEIKITNIKNDIEYYNTMFSRNCKCEIISIQIDGKLTERNIELIQSFN